MMFMANDAGVVVYDGARWDVVETETAARAVALDKDGKLYVGGKSDVGCLDVNGQGRFEYRSFRKYLPEKAQQLTDVERVYCLGDNVYYVAENFIFTAKDDGKLATITATPVSGFAGSGTDGQSLFVNIDGKGLHTFSGGRLTPVPGGETLASSYIRFMAQSPDGKVYVGTENEGMFVGASGGKFLPMSGGANDLFRNAGIFTGSMGKDGSMLIGTYSGGAMHLSSTGAVLNRYSKAGGYPSDEIYSVFLDAENGAWIAHAYGLTLVRPSLPVFSYSGISGKITSIVEDGTKLYVGTLMGLFVGEVAGGGFAGAGLNAEVLSLKKIGSRLVAATNQGLYDVTGGAKTLYLNDIPCFSISDSRQAGRFYVCHAKGVNRFQADAGGVKDLGPIEGVNFEAVSVVEDGENLWLGTSSHGLAWVKGGTVVRYGGKDGLSDGAVYVRKIVGKPAFQTKSGMFDFLPGDNKFVLNEKYTKVFGPAPRDFYSESDTRYWLFTPTGLTLATLEASDFKFDDALPINVFNKKPEAFFLNDERVWVAHQEALMRYDRKREFSPNKDFSVLIRSIVIGRDSVYFGGAWSGARNAPVYFQPTDQTPTFPFSLNAVAISFAFPSYFNADGTQYRYLLEGSGETEWSPWQTQAEVKFAGLANGNYKFRLQAKNGVGVVSKEYVFAFAIATPWYKTVWAMLLFAVALGGVVFGAVKLNSARLVRQKEELEKIVKERTAEVQKQKAELEKSNQELAAAYENLTKTQDQLVQSEKMAALGQLIAGVAHEINTPIGAINAANANLEELLPRVLKSYPGVFNALTDKEKALFFDMIRRSTEQAVVLSSREERQYRKEISQFLEAAGVADADNLSRDLVKIGLFKDLDPFLPLFKLPTAHELMEMVAMVGKMQLNLSNIGLAVAKTQKIVFALKSYSHKQQSEDPVETDVVKGLETVLTLYSNQMKAVKLVKDFDPNLPVIMGHPDELNQVWTNMIHNALQAMNNAGELRVEAKHKDNNVVVKITDSGSGIPPEIMDKIFNAFFTTKPQGEGSGLGLDISRKIIDKHRGKIDVESVPGQTTFTVTLPVS